ncbi:TPA: hypothetical protein ROG62_003556 [Enterobacter bugandensis]|nr:hypothetical protein [Enterobacter bugandensis]
MAVFIFFVSALFIGFLRMWIQHIEINKLTRNNRILQKQTVQLNNRLLQLQAQAASLSRILTRHQNIKKEMEATNDNMLQQLHIALGQDSCASRTVPDDVIRLQRNGTRVTPVPTNDYSGVFTGPLRAP